MSPKNYYTMKAYVTKVCFHLNVVYYVTKTCATKARVKAYVTQVYNITKVVVTLFDVDVIRAFICH